MAQSLRVIFVKTRSVQFRHALRMVCYIWASMLPRSRQLAAVHGQRVGSVTPKLPEAVLSTVVISSRTNSARLVGSLSGEVGSGTVFFLLTTTYSLQDVFTSQGAHREHFRYGDVYCDIHNPLKLQMYRCLTINEILEIVFAYVDGYEYIEGFPAIKCRKTSALSTLAALAYTCKTFRDAAQDVLWREIPDISVLICHLLPEEIQSYKASERTLVSQFVTWQSSHALSSLTVDIREPSI